MYRVLMTVDGSDEVFVSRDATTGDLDVALAKADTTPDTDVTLR